MHGTRDQASNISDIYRYAGELDASDKYFELKVYGAEGRKLLCFSLEMNAVNINTSNF
jgi:hypothetical protein